MQWKKAFNHVMSVTLLFSGGVLMNTQAHGQLSSMSDHELGLTVARINLPGIPALDELGFNVSDTGIEIDLDIQADIESITYYDDDGIGDNGQAGALILKGIHIGGSRTPITREQVRSNTPFKGDDLAMIHGLVIQADPQAGTLITINQFGDAYGNGVDIIVNDIFFGKELEAGEGWGLLLEDISNFVSDDYLTRVNSLFGLNLASADDGFNSPNGNFYPWKIRMLPLEGGLASTAGFEDIGGSINTSLDNIISVPGLGNSSMRLDIQFMLRMDKLALYKGDFEMGIEGLMVYQGIDTNNDGIEDTVGPATLDNFLMETIPHKLANGEIVQAMHMNIDLHADIAIENFYIGNPETGSIGAFHINDLDTHNTQLWIYAH